jgi:hypothetical protein
VSGDARTTANKAPEAPCGLRRPCFECMYDEECQHYPPDGSYSFRKEAIASTNQLLGSMELTFARCLALAARKSADYTGDDDPFANFDRAEIVGVDPLRGLLVRMIDKVSRAANLIAKDPAVRDESIADTFDDLVNYAAIGRAMVERRR